MNVSDDTGAHSSVPREMLHAGVLAIPTVFGAMTLLFKDSLRLFLCLNDLTVNLLERFTRMPKADAVRALDLFKQSVAVCKGIDALITTSKTIGCTDGEKIPDNISLAPAKLLPVLEEHVRGGGKKPTRRPSGKLQPMTAGGGAIAPPPLSPGGGGAAGGGGFANFQQFEAQQPPTPVAVSPGGHITRAERLSLLTANPANPFLDSAA